MQHKDSISSFPGASFGGWLIPWIEAIVHCELEVLGKVNSPFGWFLLWLHWSEFGETGLGFLLEPQWGSEPVRGGVVTTHGHPPIQGAIVPDLFMGHKSGSLSLNGEISLRSRTNKSLGPVIPDNFLSVSRYQMPLKIDQVKDFI